MYVTDLPPWPSPPVWSKGETMSGEVNAGEPAERKYEEMRQFVGGLSRYTAKGIPVYVDGKIPEPSDWERVFEVREDGMFYMGDYVQAEEGGLKEIRFDKVYLCERESEKEEFLKKKK